MDSRDILSAIGELNLTDCSVKIATIDKIFNVKLDEKLIDILIINTAVGTETFGHYLCVIRAQDTIYMFDSFGKSPEFYDSNLREYLTTYKLPVRIWKRRLQSFRSLACGAYVLVLIYYINKYKNLNSPYTLFRRYFTKSYFENDLFVVRHMYQLFKTLGDCKKIFCHKDLTTKTDCLLMCREVQ